MTDQEMTYQETMDYISAAAWSSWRMGLERVTELLEKLGDPQKRLRFIHVTGSNGKGSTCAMLESILREAGFRTGLFSSPGVEDFRERIRVNGEWIPAEALIRITKTVRAAAEAMEDHPSQFELVTAIGMLWFLEQECGIVVLEVGLGGLYDATNVIGAPEAAVITHIGLEHTDYLGSTLAEITAVKCGIIKTGADVVCYENGPEVMETVRRVCGEKHCRLSVTDGSCLEPAEQTLAGQRFFWKKPGEERKEYTIPLAGEFQLYNAATALTVISVLRERGWEIPEEAVLRGLALVQWPARFELLRKDPPFILDGGHNAQCADAAAESLRKYFPDQKLHFLIGILKDKDYEAVLDILLPYAKSCSCVTPDSERALPAEELAGLIERRGVPAEAFSAVPQAVKACLEKGEPVFAFGSLYMAGKVRKAVREYGIRAEKKKLRKAVRDIRKSIPEEERRRKNLSICARLWDLPEIQNAKTVFSYAATEEEADLEPLHEQLRKAGKRVAFPVIGESSSGKKMTARVPEDPACMEKGIWGIRAPKPEGSLLLQPSEIDVILIPCVAYARSGTGYDRLGYGGGFYDRYLAACPPGVRKILVAFREQETGLIPTEETDISIPALITD